MRLMLQEKKPWQKPVLTEHGDVERITLTPSKTALKTYGGGDDFCQNISTIRID